MKRSAFHDCKDCPRHAPRRRKPPYYRTPSQSKRVLRRLATSGGALERVLSGLQVTRRTRSHRVTRARASPPTLAACQSPGVTDRLSPSRRVTRSRPGETVRQHGIPFFRRRDPSPRPAGGRGNSRQPFAIGVPLLTRGCFGKITNRVQPPWRRHFINLGKFTRTGTAMKFINRFLGEILPSGDVDGFEPASFTPAPCRAWRHTHLLQPPGQADDCRAGDRIRFAV